MPKKFKVTNTRDEAKRLHRIINTMAGWPGPGSRLVDGKLTNVCPDCIAAKRISPLAGWPWECTACGWTAAAKPESCPCQEVVPIYETEDGRYAVDMGEHDPSTSDRISAEDKVAWAQAAQDTVDELPPGPPEWAPAKGR